MSARRNAAIVMIGAAMIADAASAGRSQPAASDVARRARLILQRSCVGCHNAEVAAGGLRFDRDPRRDAGTSSPIVPGDAAHSRVIQRLSRSSTALRMPPRHPLPDAEVEVITTWIDRGAEWPADADAAGRDVGSSAPLLSAIRGGDRARARALLAQGASANARDADGTTALMLSLIYADGELVRDLIASGADVRAAADTGATALHYAAADASIARALVRAGAEVDARSRIGKTPLIDAAGQVGAADTIRILLDAGADLRARSRSGVTATTAAAANPDASVMEALLDYGADVDETVGPGLTPLILAANAGNDAVVRLLLERGADVRAKIANGVNVVWAAAAFGRVPILRALIDEGGDVNAVHAPTGISVLMRAASSDFGSADAVKLLLDRGADRSHRDKDGATALTLARRRGRDAVAEFLAATEGERR